MDVVVLSAEDIVPYKSFYHRVLDIMDSANIDTSRNMVVESDREEAKKRKLRKRSTGKDKWAVKFFDFDNLALIKVAAWREIGQWDVFIPYYTTDCDAYSRMVIAGYRRDDVQAGYMFDVAGVLDDPEERFFPGTSQKSRDKWGFGPEGPEPAGGRLNSWRFRSLKSSLNATMEQKRNNTFGRNTWQGAFAKAQKRKPAEPWSYDPRGFQSAWWATADAGRETYIKKWGTMKCELNLVNKTEQDIWLLDYLKEGSEEYMRRKAEEDHWLSVHSAGHGW
jgi:hypothetical protein